MERYTGMDVHAGSCALAVISEKGRKLKDFPAETNGQAMVEAVRMRPGRAPWGLTCQNAWYRWCGKRGLKSLFPRAGGPFRD